MGGHKHIQFFKMFHGHGPHRVIHGPDQASVDPRDDALPHGVHEHLSNDGILMSPAVGVFNSQHGHQEQFDEGSHTLLV